MKKNTSLGLLFILFLSFSGCITRNANDLFSSSDRFEDIRTYESDFSSRIEVLLGIAEEELRKNYEQKKFLMIGEDKPRAVLHPRKDIFLRELILSAHQDNRLTDEQMSTHLKKCDHLYALWEKHWMSAEKKARQLGYTR